MNRIPVDWEHVKSIDPDNIIDGEEAEDGVVLALKDGKLLKIAPKYNSDRYNQSYYSLGIGELTKPNRLVVDASMCNEEDGYSAMSLSIRIGRYGYFQHSFVDGVPELDANRICTMTMYDKEEQYGNKHC